MRWKEETRTAAEHLGWTVVETDGVSDWQGWGVHLLRREVLSPDVELVLRDAEIEGRHTDAARLREHADKVVTWAVMPWGYGSCSGCDSYENQDTSTPEACAAVFGELISVVGASEEDARLKFSGSKGW